VQPSGARRCPKCSGEVRDGWRVCPACLTPLATEADETKTAHLRESPPSSSSSVEEGRFPAGTVLAGRYRIVGLLGHGGMGEVYRAYDLILNQAVALKFLAAPQVSEATLARFRNEVRIARQVSHPNVCRVYEILAPLGAGGMGEVYKARDTRLNREVAITVVPDDFARDRRASSASSRKPEPLPL